MPNDDITKLPIKTTVGNLTQEERLAIQSLTNNSEITIKPSDKGENIVIMDNSQYVSMCQKILSNKSWYIPFPTL